jgi:hypothetical protein
VFQTSEFEDPWGRIGLNAARATGDIPQNVNYAVKSTYALALLEPYLDSTVPEAT